MKMASRRAVRVAGISHYANFFAADLRIAQSSREPYPSERSGFSRRLDVQEEQRFRSRCSSALAPSPKTLSEITRPSAASMHRRTALIRDIHRISIMELAPIPADCRQSEIILEIGENTIHGNGLNRRLVLQRRNHDCIALFYRLHSRIKLLESVRRKAEVRGNLLESITLSHFVFLRPSPRNIRLVRGSEAPETAVPSAKKTLFSAVSAGAPG